MLAANTTTSDVLLGVAAVITALGGLIGGIAATVGALRGKRHHDAGDDDAAAEEAGRLWQQMLERLDDAETERDQARTERDEALRRYDECNAERLDLLRHRPARRQ